MAHAAATPSCRRHGIFASMTWSPFGTEAEIRALRLVDRNVGGRLSVVHRPGSDCSVFAFILLSAAIHWVRQDSTAPHP
mgnify:CR=1 FL=1